MAIRSSKIASVADSNDATKVQPSDIDPWSTPASPVNKDIRFEDVGTAPNRFIRIWIYLSGGWVKVYEIQINV